MNLLQFTVADYFLCFGLLVALTVNRWSQGGWMPVSSEHVPTDSRTLTINGIPIEVLYGPDAVRHPYKLSEPDETLLWVEPIATPFDYEASWRRSVMMMRAQWRIAAQVPPTINPFENLSGC